MTPIDELVQGHLLKLLRCERNLVIEHMLEIVGDVLARNALAYERLEQFAEATAVHESLNDIFDALDRDARRDEVMRCG